jgi:hypothetical protein
MEHSSLNQNETIKDLRDSINLSLKLFLLLSIFIIIFVLITHVIFSLELFFLLIFIPILGIFFGISIINIKGEIRRIRKYLCSKCNFVNDEDAKYCKKCGTKLN